MENAITNYCSEQGIKMGELAKITDVSVAQLYRINENPKYDVKVRTINNIYQGTQKRFGVGLSADKYLDFECLK